MLENVTERAAEMKIRHLTYSESGGAGRIAYELADFQKSKGLDSQVMSATKAGIEGDILRHPVRGVEALFDFYLVRKTLKAPLFSLARRGSAGWINRQFLGKDLVCHLHWTPGVLSSRDFSQLSRESIPIVWTLHDMWPITGGCHHAMSCQGFKSGCSKCPQVRELFQPSVETQQGVKQLMISQHQAVTFVAPSKWMQRQAKESLIAGNADVQVIPNPVDMEPFKNQHKEQNRSRYGIEIDAFVVGCAAVNLGDPIKNIQDINLITRQLRSMTDHPVYLMAIGSGEPVGGFDNGVIRLGNLSTREEMATAYSAMDIFLSTSLVETFPTTLLEASAAGIPSMVYPNGGMPDIVTDCHNGYVVANVSEAVQRLFHALDKNEELLRLGHKAREIVELEYSLSTVSASYMEIYQKLKEQLDSYRSVQD